MSVQHNISFTLAHEDPSMVPYMLAARNYDFLYLLRARCSTGHCPHHEAPKAVDWAILKWISSDGQRSPVAEGSSIDIQEDSGSCIHIVCQDGRPNNKNITNWITVMLAFFEGIFKSQGHKS